MALGGTNKTSGIGVLASAGLGWDNAAKVWFDTETKLLSIDSTYEDAARGTVASAKLLFGDGAKEVKAVECAWLAVGVLKDVVCDCSVEEKPQGRAKAARESSPDTKPATEDCAALTCKPVDDPGDTASENIPLESGDRICGSSERFSDQAFRSSCATTTPTCRSRCTTPPATSSRAPTVRSRRSTRSPAPRPRAARSTSA
jgi:hypothetical protein